MNKKTKTLFKNKNLINLYLNKCGACYLIYLFALLTKWI